MKSLVYNKPYQCAELLLADLIAAAHGSTKSSGGMGLVYISEIWLCEALLGEVMHVLHEMMLFHFFVGVVTECRLCLIQVNCCMVFLCCGCFVLFSGSGHKPSLSEFLFFLKYACNAKDKN